MGNYTTLTLLKAFRPPSSSAIPDFTNWSDAELTVVIDEVEARIESDLNDFFYQKSAQTIYANGTKGSRIHLPQDAAYPHKIISITSVEEVDFDQTTVIETYTEGSDFVIEEAYISAGTYYVQFGLPDLLDTKMLFQMLFGIQRVTEFTSRRNFRPTQNGS